MVERAATPRAPSRCPTAASTRHRRSRSQPRDVGVDGTAARRRTAAGPACAGARATGVTGADRRPAGCRCSARAGGVPAATPLAWTGWAPSAPTRPSPCAKEDLVARVAALHTERPFDAVLDYSGVTRRSPCCGPGCSHPSTHYHLTRWVQIGSMAGLDITPLPAGLLRARRSRCPHRFRQCPARRTGPRPHGGPAAAVGHGGRRPVSPRPGRWRGWSVRTAAEPSGTRVVLVP